MYSKNFLLYSVRLCITKSVLCMFEFQACECHAFDVPSPAAHYRAVCRSLVEEAMAIRGLREEDTGEETERKKQTVSCDCDYHNIISVSNRCADLL